MNKFSNIYKRIFDSSLIKQSHVFFKDLLFTTKPTTNLKLVTTKHLYNEMPIRFSQRIKDLNAFPFGLKYNHNVNIVRDWYITSFCEMIEDNAPKNDQECDKFKEKIKNIYDRHSSVILTLNRGLVELKESGNLTTKNDLELHNFLDRFHSSRTEIRILIEHYLSMFDSKNLNGVINMDVNINSVLGTCVQNIGKICEKQNHINFDINDIVKINGNENLPFIENYLYYILFEILKNSTQGIIDKQKIMPNIKPIIKIDLKNTEDYVCIKIVDNGIGIKQQNMQNIWSYSFSTNPIPANEIIGSDDFSNLSPLSGFGYGLPICKIYLNFFGGFINIESNEGFKTTVYIFLRKYKSL